MPSAAGTRYDRLAPCYEALSALYGLGAIRACKASQLAFIEPGDHVLYAGAGEGREAVLAARRGAEVTLLDLAPPMLARARRRFRREGLEAELLLGDILAHHREGFYDVVAANFFLNVFEAPVMRAVLAHLARQLRPGGRLLIADFTPAIGPPLAKVARWLYFGAAVLACRVLAGNPLHGMHDYEGCLGEAGLRLEARRCFGRGLFRTLRAVRDEPIN